MSYVEKPFIQPSVMSSQSHFAQAPSADVQRSTFDRSHAVKTTFDAGKLIPIYLDEVLPGDTFNMDTTAFCRLATPLRPVMDNMYLDIHYWFVPNRLLYNKWQEFMGERKRPDDNPNDVSVPTLRWNPPTGKTNAQDYVGLYFGLPRLSRKLGPGNPDPVGVDVSVLPFRAYKLIYNEWYRDENLCEPVSFTDGEFDPTIDSVNSAVLRRGKRHDYFTSSLPWPQKGDPVVIPLGTEVPVYGYRPNGRLSDMSTPFAVPGSDVPNAQGTNGNYPQNWPMFFTGIEANNGTPEYYVSSTPAPGRAWQAGTYWPAYLNPDQRVATADLTEATTVSINELRTAFQIQKLLERDARGGTRYIELILSHFGVRSDDARLQRPEYLGGGSTRVNVSPLPSTATVPTQAPQGNLAGVGTAVGNARFTKSFTEHGLIIGLASVRADLTYQNGVDRLWTRRTRYDYYWPALAHLGEQAVLEREIFFTGQPAIDDQVFGYQERYAEYRYKPSMITGLFNSDCQAPLDTWHLAQHFDEPVYLNEDFILEYPPIDRISAVPSEPDFLCDIWHDLKTTRPMPVYSVPGLIDHF